MKYVMEDSKLFVVLENGEKKEIVDGIEGVQFRMTVPFVKVAGLEKKDTP